MRNLTKISDIQEAVNERVNARFPSILYDALIKQHTRHGYKSSCQCDYCQKKREVNYWRGYSSYYSEALIDRARNTLRCIEEKDIME